MGEGLEVSDETWAERKAKRRVHYELFVKGRKLVDCGACYGSGRYDHNGAPACSQCGGTGKVRETPFDLLLRPRPGSRNGYFPK
jgi:hypothetical protein